MVHCCNYSQYSILGYFEFLIVLGFWACTLFITWTVIYEGNLTRELLIDEGTTLSTRDENHHIRIIRSLALTDIVLTEHYKSSDTNGNNRSGSQNRGVGRFVRYGARAPLAPSLIAILPQLPADRFSSATHAIAFRKLRCGLSTMEWLTVNG